MYFVVKLVDIQDFVNPEYILSVYSTFFYSSSRVFS